MVEGERGGSLRYVITVVIVIATLALVGCGTLTLLPHQADSTASGFRTIKDLATAYSRIRPGLTRASQLARLGFNSGSGNAEVLSYLGVMERFMPRDSVKFDRLDAAIQDCIEARDRCTALVFKSADGSADRLGSSILSAFGLGAASAGTAQPPEVTLLVQNGRVAFKMISGVAAATVQRRAGTVSAPHNSTALMPVAYRTIN